MKCQAVAPGRQRWRQWELRLPPLSPRLAWALLQAEQQVERPELALPRPTPQQVVRLERELARQVEWPELRLPRPTPLQLGVVKREVAALPGRQTLLRRKEGSSADHGWSAGCYGDRSAPPDAVSSADSLRGSAPAAGLHAASAAAAPWGTETGRNSAECGSLGLGAALGIG